MCIFIISHNACPQQTYIDLLSVNLRFEAVFIKERLNIRWVSEAGLIENIEHVVEEYKQTRGLLVSHIFHTVSVRCSFH